MRLVLNESGFGASHTIGHTASEGVLTTQSFVPMASRLGDALLWKQRVNEWLNFDTRSLRLDLS